MIREMRISARVLAVCRNRHEVRDRVRELMESHGFDLTKPYTCEFCDHTNSHIILQDPDAVVVVQPPAAEPEDWQPVMTYPTGWNEAMRATTAARLPAPHVDVKGTPEPPFTETPRPRRALDRRPIGS